MGVVCFFCFAAIFITSSYGDEQYYHYPLAQNISLSKIINTGSDYSSAYTPLPYLAGNLVLKISSSLVALRILNYAVFLLTIYFFYLLAKEVSKDHLVLTLLFFLNPYLLKASYLFIMFNWGLLFILIALNIYFSEGKARQLRGDFFLLLAVLCQQWMLVVVLAVLLYQLDLFFKGKIKINFLAKSFIGKFVIFLPAILLFYSWQGLTHPNFASHSLQPTFEHLNGVLANIGFLMFLVVLANYKNLLKMKNVLLLFPLPLLWLAIPKHSLSHGPREITGIVSQLVTKVYAGMHIPYDFSMFFFIIAGYLFLLLIISKNENDLAKIFQYAVLGFFIAFIASSRLAASHIYISLPLILLLFRAEIEKMKRTKNIMITQFFLLSLVYLIYITFYRSQGITF